MAPLKRISRGQVGPEEYIRSACTLHLQAPLSSKCDSIVKAFLAGKGGGGGDDDDATTGTTKASPRLFIWIPKDGSTSSDDKKSDDDDDDVVVEAFATMDHLHTNNLGAIVFLNNTLASKLSSVSASSSGQEPIPVKHVSQLSCIVLSPRQYEEEEEEPSLEEEKDEPKKTTMRSGDSYAKTEDYTLKSLQMYTRHCFVPAVRALEEANLEEQQQKASTLGDGGSSAVTSSSGAPSSGAPDEGTTAQQASSAVKDKKSIMLDTLEDKLRQLDVALDQVQRTQHASIAMVHLHTHPTLARAAEKLSSSDVQNLSKMDLSTVGLQESLYQDDTFLNDVQRLVQTQWITSIQKVTSLPSSTPFPPMGPGADTEEIQFWKSLEEALSSIRMELDKPQVLLTVQVLKTAKRFLATMALENNTGLDDAENITTDICTFLQQIPLEELKSSRDIGSIQGSIQSILTVFPRVRLSRRYGLDRALDLLESITFTISDQITQVLRINYKSSGLILKLDYHSYLAVQESLDQLWDEWDSGYSKFKEFVLDYTRKVKGSLKRETTEQKTASKILDDLTLHHSALRERLHRISTFRNEHERLRTVVVEVLGGAGGGGNDNDPASSASEDPQAVRDVEEAPFAVFATVDVLDVSERGQVAFGAALEEYDRRMDGMEERLARLLRTKLEVALEENNADDMFRVFARFHPLLFRTRVRAAVKDFQLRLIQTVTEAIGNLQSKFSERYETSPSSMVATVRGIPPVSGKILWAKQMDRQVRTWMGRMGNVLGADWGQQLEGKALKRTCDELLAKLDATTFLRSWIKDWEREITSMAGQSKVRSFPLLITKDHKTGTTYVMKVNMDPKLDELFREVRLLQFLGYSTSIPKMVVTTADEAYGRHSYVNTLRTAFNSYTSVRACVTPDLEPLLENELIAIRNAISDAFDISPLATAASGGGSSSRKLLSSSSSSSLALVASKRTTPRIRWEDKNIGIWVTTLSQLITSFEERVDLLLQSSTKVEDYLVELQHCPYASKEMMNVIEKLQSTLDELSLAGFSHLRSWVEGSIVGRMKDVLCERLKEGIDEFILVLEGDEVSTSSSNLDIPPVNVEILLRNQEIVCHPSVPHVRNMLYDKLHDHIGIVCNLPKPDGSRFEVFDSKSGGGAASGGATTSSGDTSLALQDEGNAGECFSMLMDDIPPHLLIKAYATMERHVHQCQAFVNNWRSYQALWDTRLSDVVDELNRSDGEDGDITTSITIIDDWYESLMESRKERLKLDANSQVQRTSFGPIWISHSKVQNQVNLKYDAWQRDLQMEFAKVLDQQLRHSHEILVEARTKLEHVSLLEGSTSDLVSGVTYIQKMTQMCPVWEKETKALQQSERFLKQERVNFTAAVAANQHPAGNAGGSTTTTTSVWMEASRVRGQFDSLEQILQKRQKIMKESTPLLQQRILSEEKLHKVRVKEVLQEWDVERPLRGTIEPPAALELLMQLETKLQKSSKDESNLVSAKDALGMESTISNESDLMRDALQDLGNLKEVWSSIRGPHETLETLKETPWSTATPRKIRASLEDLTRDLRALPNRVRQYDAFTYFLDYTKKLLNGNSVLVDLKTEALKARHWKTILSRLKIQIPYSSLTVGMLWDSGVLTRKKEMAEILSVAQGEMAIEVFLSDLRERWTKQELELVLYQNRIRLIKGWDQLFATLDEHMGGLVLMKSSPFYRSVREFQEEGTLWEDRLTKLRAALDVWVDVQRRWVYLEGIFFGSADIKAHLPSEWTRFKSVDGEFVTLMRRIAQRPYVMEALNIDNLQRTLERLSHLMTLIQRALGDYLEKQRSEFSRFYFLGDEDLLEIVGNSGEPGKVLSHVGKMFASIASATMTQGKELANDELVARLDGMLSKDGEIVSFSDAECIDIPKGGSAKQWLRLLEKNMQTTLAGLLHSAISSSPDVGGSGDVSTKSSFGEWAQKFPAQVMILAVLVSWSMGVEEALSKNGADSSKEALQKVSQEIETKLEIMAQSVLLDQIPPDVRKKFEQLITELVHQRDVTRSLINDGLCDPNDFRWLYHLRFKYNSSDQCPLQEKLQISLSDADFYYGFEYLGIGERLVQTPLTDRCYLTLTQALRFRLGGNPFGPAGTGKTESVKALGSQLGRFVVVMNCDEAFDFGAMGRIFCGLCQVGAWGCFDEFNRLEERILSAVSQQILTIQRGLLERQQHIELLGRSIQLHDNVGIFVTMNPGYAGRSNLPDNLKNLFRAVAMVVPDRQLIAQVMLFSQGIVTAEQLSGKIVTLFQRCEDEMSKQSHYDFGLRALKTLLISAGGLKRKALKAETEDGGSAEEDSQQLATLEKSVLIEGTCNNVVPKLVSSDLTIFHTILEEVFPGSQVTRMEDEDIRTKLVEMCTSKFNLEPDESWVQKVLQLKQVIDMRHGVMMVGPSGVGKSSAIHVLVKVLEEVEGRKGEIYIIDPKAMSKEALYGSLDGTTMEWTDGVFTYLLRKILANERGEADKRHYILFDGDVDPEWAENLNSVLDDNKLLTLPSGERLSIPDNLRILLEVDSLEQATLATVSRCGMVWFSEETVTTAMCLKHLLNELRRPLGGSGGGSTATSSTTTSEGVPLAQTSFVDAISALVLSEDSRTTSLVEDALDFALKEEHIMHASRERLLTTLKSLLIRGIEAATEYDETHPDFPMTGDHMTNFAKKWMLYSLLWAFTGSASWEIRTKFGTMLMNATGLVLPQEETTLADYRIKVEDGEWELWSESVPRMEIESHRVMATDIVVTTTDTLRHTDVVWSWLVSRKPLILCGPPGSGKSMTLTSVLQSLESIVLTSLNFSSGTTPDIILKTFSQYCHYVRRGKDLVLQPLESLGSNKWLVVFCDEINLPENDAYGTQRVIMFMRQLVEQGGFWRDDNVWIKIDRIQFVGACNPPSDAGRVLMSPRFLRHAPLLFVDFPARDSMMQIYRTFNGGMLKLFPNLRGETDPLTEAMVELYSNCQTKFKPHMQPQYVYSPRELSRWVRGIYEAVVKLDALSREELVRIWAHEALRLFCDRLVDVDEREWCNQQIDDIAQRWFANTDHALALKRPILYTTWLSKDAKDVNRNELKDFLSARLRVFYEEELDVPLVVFDEVLEHVLRIDRVLRQPMGHCLLVGDSGAGKTVLSKFVSWMNGLSIFQIKAHSRYGLSEFNEDLRAVMRRVGIDGERICFIFDEGNALGSGFLEAMNALLASGEVPGLFEGDDYTTLMHAIRDSAAKEGQLLDSEEELWKRFTTLVQRNLHVVFTMNPSGGEWKNRSTTSPALFNRCVVDWFGTWSGTAMGQVGKEFTSRLDLGEDSSGTPGSDGGGWTYGVGNGEEIMKVVREAFGDEEFSTLRAAVVAALVNLHGITKTVVEELGTNAGGSRTFMSPRDYLGLIHNFVSCTSELRSSLEEEQLHINAGLAKLLQTQESVTEMEVGLGAKGTELRQKETLANNKLQQMVADQNEAEKRKDAAEKLSANLEIQEQQIKARQEEAQRDLDEAEPALLSAQASVKGIKRRDLDEVKGLARPPAAVKLTLEAVGVMMGEKSVEWADIRKMLSKTDFIPTVLNFDANSLTARQIKIVNEKYLKGSDLTVETVTRSSRACGPLFSWVQSQIKYSTVYTKVQPLRQEVAQLEEEASSARKEKEDTEREVAKLEESITRYKADYAQLIRDVEALKTEMETVKTKVDRARALITSLSHESERWSHSREGFEKSIRCLVGDGLILAAFLTYFGFFDFKTRTTLLEKWKDCLDTIGIEYRHDLSIIDVLSKASDRLLWQGEGLPPDSLSMENGVILERCSRFPLIIDPSGEAINFVMNKYRNQKIHKTSFMDKSFMKTLAGAVRFGTALLVENVETVDPILNPILNKEIQKTGGRSLVRIGTEDVDYSPNFRLVLSTKNPAAKLTPDLCSRVTLLNFTVTPDSLQSQSLSMVLKSQKPQIEEQRVAVLKLQGEQHIKLRELEEMMLAKISAVEGNILDDDQVVDGMQLLMKEGAQVEEQIAKSTIVMQEVDQAISQFRPLGQACRSLFLLLQRMRDVHHLYEFSSTFFMTVLQHVLSTSEKNNTDSNDSSATETESLSKLKLALFSEISARVGRGLFQEDKIVFNLLLAHIFQDSKELLLSSKTGAPSSVDGIVTIITDSFGNKFDWEGRGLDHLKLVTFQEIDCHVPLMLCSAPGHDVSGRVESMARRENKTLDAVAMGSAEGFVTADRMVASAAKRGTWVMLKNCHLCTDWLQDTLVKTLQSHSPHGDFRLFITSEISSKLPTALLRMCDIIVAEAPGGVRATLLRFLSGVSPDRFDNPTKNRLYLTLGWIHAVIQERLRYVPVGWSKAYEFTEADAHHGLDVLDSLIAKSCGTTSTTMISPDTIPFEAIRATLCKGVFGGRVTVPSDQSVLDTLVNGVMVPECFNIGFSFVEGIPSLPDSTSTREDCLSWIESLPAHTSPSWIGLDATAESTRAQMIVNSIVNKYETLEAKGE